MSLGLNSIGALLVPSQFVFGEKVGYARRRSRARPAKLALGATVRRSQLTKIPTQDSFAAFEMVDSNFNVRIDAGFAQLRVWRDLNKDGIPDSGELMTLAEASVEKVIITRVTSAICWPLSPHRPCRYIILDATNNCSTIGFIGHCTRVVTTSVVHNCDKVQNLSQGPSR